MTTSKFLLIVALVVSVTTGVILCGDPQQPTAGTLGLDGLEKRLREDQSTLDDHEKRLAKVEQLLARSGSITPADAKGKEAPPPNQPSGGFDILGVRIANKKYQPSDIHADRYEDHIWWDATYTAKSLAKKTRSIKGTMQFCDLFGTPKFQIGVTINDPLEPGKELTTTGVGFDYNQFSDSHQWMQATSLTDMTFRFKVESILYADGTRADF